MVPTKVMSGWPSSLFECVHTFLAHSLHRPPGRMGLLYLRSHEGVAETRNHVVRIVSSPCQAAFPLILHTWLLPSKLLPACLLHSPSGSLEANILRESPFGLLFVLVEKWRIRWCWSPVFVFILWLKWDHCPQYYVSKIALGVSWGTRIFPWFICDANIIPINRQL